MAAEKVRGRSLDDFAHILRHVAAQSTRWVVVGGQAVNVWANHYSLKESELEAYRPFTSKDLDLVGDEDDVQALARSTGTKPIRPRKAAASPIIAIFEFRTDTGPLTVEVLNGLAHLTREDVATQALAISHATIKPEIKVLNPIACLIDKTGNLTRFNQNARQDLRHVRILIPCTRAFIREALHAAGKGEVTPRSCVSFLEQVLRSSHSRAAIDAHQKYGINWSELWPVDALQQTDVEQIKRFVQHRLRLPTA